MVHRRIPSLNWLRTFEAAARAESFAAAGRRLNMSAAAVSQQIGALEGNLGAKLFERGPRSVALTAAGHAFLPAVRQGLSTVEASAAALFGAAAGRALTVRAPSIFATSWLAARMGDFTDKHPDIRLSLLCDDAGRETPWEEVAFDIVLGRASPGAGEAHRLFGETVYPLARPDVAARIEGPEDLGDHRLIEVSMHDANWIRLLAPYLDLQRLSASIVYVDLTDVALAMAAAGYGVALARAPASDDLARALGLTRCLEGLELAGENHYRLTRPADATASSAAERFREWILKASALHR